MAIAGLIVAMVVLSIAGSAYWRPEPSDRITLELGGDTPMGFDGRAPNDTISRVLDLVAPTVVFLTIPEAGRSGSGVVVHAAGFIVTNAHVVEGVKELRVAFKDGVEYDAEVFGVDRATDLAVVKVDGDGRLPVAALGDSDALQVGEFVLALGAPFGLEATATSGIVSGLHRRGLGIARYEDFIVTDAPINRGNSGGPLVNLRGEVVGINTAIIAGDEGGHGLGGFSGVGFAIPVNVMRVVAQRLIGDGGLAAPGDRTPEGPGSTGKTARQGLTRRPQTIAFEAPRVFRRPAGLASTGPFDRGTEREAQLPSAPIPEGAVAMVQGFDARGVSLGVGTGFFVGSDIGVVLVTNEHVVRNAQTVDVFVRQGSTRVKLEGSVLAENAALDLALVQVADGARVSTLELANAESLGVGDAIRAVGARSENQSVRAQPSAGVVIALGVRVAGIATQVGLIETDAPIERGDSGGPLVNAADRVVGVMVARENGVGGELGDRRSYAIPLVLGAQVQALVDAALSDILDPGIIAAYSPGYILVINPDPEGEAVRQGLRAYDHIEAIDGRRIPIPDPGDMVARSLYLRFRQRPPGSVVDLLVSRVDEDRGGRVEVHIRFVVPGGSRVP